MLEEKQRAVRRYNEKYGIIPKPNYFEEWVNPHDPENLYFRYNGKYFEKDRLEGNWSHLPDIYSEKLPPLVEEFERQSKKK